jgi:hypothetical protein
LVRSAARYLNRKPGLTKSSVRPAAATGGMGKLSSTRIPLVPIETMRRFCFRLSVRSRALVRERGWTARQYEDWLVRWAGRALVAQQQR